MRTNVACLALILPLSLSLLSVGCGGGGGVSSPTPTASATATPTPGPGTPTLASVNFTSGGQNLTLIFHGTNLTWTHYKMSIGGVDGDLLENANNPDGSAVSGIVQPRPASLLIGVAYPIAIYVSTDGISFTKVADPPTGPLTFTYTV